MIFQRIGLTTAVVAITLLPACSMWNSMTDRITGRSTTSDSAMRGGTSGGTMSGGSASGGAMPGASMSSMRTSPANAEVGRMGFRTYNECRVWFSNNPTSRATNQGALQGGELTMADQDPCAQLPRS